MTDIVHPIQKVSAQDYMMNLMVDGDEDEDVRLHLAAVCGDFENLKMILSESNSSTWINYRVRPYLSPPIRLTVSGDSPKCAQLLLNAGCQVDLEDVKGQTALFVATCQRKLELMKILLKHGANPDGSPKNRSSPLLIAAGQGFAEGVQVLLKNGANPEPFETINTCVPGWPLHHSIVYAHFSCFFALLQGGALANLSDLPYSLADGVITKLSIPHAILKYAKEYPEFMHLFHECGGNLGQIDSSGAIFSETRVQDSPVKEALHFLACKPLSLKSLTRIRLRRLFGRLKLHLIEKLEIPASLILFLHYKDFSRDSLISVTSKHNTSEECKK